VLIKMNAPKANLEKIVNLLPALQKPTISMLYGEEWCAIETVIIEDILPTLLPELKKNGVKDIIEFELKKIIP